MQLALSPGLYLLALHKPTMVVHICSLTACTREREPKIQDCTVNKTKEQSLALGVLAIRAVPLTSDVEGLVCDYLGYSVLTCRMPGEC